MVRQYVWIAIAIGVFFAGIGVGYAALQPAPIMPQTIMSQQQMQQMMSDPDFRQQMMNQWMHQTSQDPQLMQNWMNNMMNDPQMRQQMYDSMMQHNQFMQGMMSNQQFQNQWMDSSMGHGMMNQGMMGHGMMMGQPITQQSEVLSTISKIKDMLDQATAAYSADDKKKAMSLATQAYLENYEYIEGTIAQKDLGMMQKVELAMRVDLRSMIQEGAPKEMVESKVTSIKSDLTEIESLFK